MPSVSLPKGGGAVRGIGEKFSANPVTGTGSMSVPIATSPGRSGFGPQLSLSYDSGAGNGPFGLGWSLSLPFISRKTDKGLPRYLDEIDSDTYLLAGAEDLVPQLDANGQRPVPQEVTVHGKQYQVRRYRPRIEGLFALIECWREVGVPANVFWRSISRVNVTTWFGRSEDSRVFDPDDPSRIFQWLISQTHDDKGNVAVYSYERENSIDVDVATPWEANRTKAARQANAHLKRVKYGNVEPFLPKMDEVEPDELPKQWLLETVFDYGDHAGAFPSPKPDAKWHARADAFSTLRAGFEVRTYRLCRRVLMFHHFKDAPGVGLNCLVRATEFDYLQPAPGAPAESPGYTTLQSVTHRHYQRRDNSFVARELPPVSLRYSKPVVDVTPRSIGTEQLENLPVGTQGPGYRWIDLDGEGLSGVLSEQLGGWYYKPNRGDGTFGPMRLVAPVPAMATAAGSQHLFMDLAGNGEIDVVEFSGPAPGFHERSHDTGWKQHVPFASLPNIDWNDPNLRFVDLSGDGHADALITEHEVFTWYPSLDERGFAAGQRTRQPMDEDAGPHLVFADGTQSIFLADMCGDGLTDLVRVRHSEVCYWPNLGYGRFGRKITLGGAPHFDSIDQFDPARVRLADIDGSGPVDIIYLGGDGARLYFNRSGNELSPPLNVPLPVATHNLAAVQVADLLGNGTACLVWNSHLPANSSKPVHYIDLMGGAPESPVEHRRHEKPHLLIEVNSNLGATTTIEYTPSTRFYLQDLQAGRPWVTRLPFPVHCVSKVTVHDKWRRTTFSTSTSYHHGHFDGVEREFRGFGRVEQWDTQALRDVQLANTGSAYVTQDRTLYQPPVKTVTWYHTGVADQRQRVLGAFEHEYFTARHAELLRQAGFAEPALPQPDIDAGAGPALDADEWREALRACKGMPLRQEVYELDARALEETGQHVPVRLFSAAQHNCHIRRIQARGAHRHAVFLALESEAYTAHYELDLRAPATELPQLIDPRIAHTLNLRFDDYGRFQQAVAVVYPRHRPFADANLSTQQQDLIRSVQAERHIAYTESHFTRELDPSLHRLHHRAPLPCEVLTYELTGDDGATGFVPSRGRYFAPADFRKFSLSSTLPGQGSAAVVDIGYHQQPGSAAAHKRLVEHVRSLYWADALATAAPSAALPYGQHGPRGLKYEDYKLALTDDLLAAVFGTGTSTTPPADRLAWEAAPAANGQPAQTCRDLLNTPSTSGYIHGTAVGMPRDQYWMRSGTAGFNTDAHLHFFLPERFTDAFDTTTTLSYDALDWYVASSADAKGNRVSVEAFDFRVLAPSRMRDANHNVSAVAFDILGLPVAAATLGKVQPASDSAPESTETGERLDEFVIGELNPALAEVAEFFNPSVPTDPLDQPLARDWLGKATVRFVYHFGETRGSQGDVPKWAASPAGACSIARERHERDLPNTEANAVPVQIAFEYSDGNGQAFVKNVQAEPEAPGGALRWITNGLTIVNNKGKPVLQYEPYFTDTGHRFAEPKAVGVSPVMLYDAPGRLVRTDLPDGTFSRVEVSPWHSRSFDANDTVPESRWYRERLTTAERGSGATPGSVDEEDKAARTSLQQKRAARLAERHADTPAETHFDSLGREVIAIAHNRTPDANGVWADERHLTFTKLDAEGKQLWIRDARGNLVMQYITPPKPTRWADETNERMPAGSSPCYDIAGNLLHQHSMDAGDRWMLLDAAGKPMLAWDLNDKGPGTPMQRRLYRTDYDALHRPVAQWLKLDETASALIESFEYEDTRRYTDAGFTVTDAEGLERAQARNLLGQAVQRRDPSGLAGLERIDISGQPAHVTRRLIRADVHSTDGVVDWKAGDSLLELASETFHQITDFDALGRMTRLFNWHRDLTFDANGGATLEKGATNRVAAYVPAYNARGLLQSEWLHVRASKSTADEVAEFQLQPGVTRSAQAIEGITYNAKGQKEALRLGNGSTTTYTYDNQTFRLTRLTTRRTIDNKALQKLAYVYDAVGNITHIHDEAQETAYHHNAVIRPEHDYRYDALYRLIEATGRENSLTPSPPPRSEGRWPQGAIPTDHIPRNYSQRYVYDTVGNFVRMEHRADNNVEWTRHYTTQPDSNRLASNWYGSAPHEAVTYLHDAHGSMLNLNRVNLAPPEDPDEDWGRRIAWDWRDMIHRFDAIGGGVAQYHYGIDKQRTRKHIVRNGGSVEDRIYLGGYELYRRSNAQGEVVEDIESHHLFEGEQRVLLVDDVLLARGQPGPSGISLTVRTCWRYQFGNHLGSVGLELDEAARVISYEEFHPYGTSAFRLISNDAAVWAPAKRYRYTGMERDEESGLSYHTARCYLPWLGRWVSSDPKGLVDGTNLYLWVLDNPVNRIDPTGTQERPDVFRSMPPWLQKKILSGSVNDQTSNALRTVKLKDFKNVEPTREKSWEDHALDVLTLGGWMIGWTGAGNYEAVSDAPATSDWNPVAKVFAATGMTAGDVTGTRDIVEGLRAQDTLNTRTFSPDESFNKVVGGSTTLVVTLALSALGPEGSPAGKDQFKVSMLSSMEEAQLARTLGVEAGTLRETTHLLRVRTFDRQFRPKLEWFELSEPSGVRRFKKVDGKYVRITDTEQKALARGLIERGDIVVMEGTLPPCSGGPGSCHFALIEQAWFNDNYVVYWHNATPSQRNAMGFEAKLYTPEEGFVPKQRD